MSADKLIIKYAMKGDERKEFYHSSGYGMAQNEQGLGVAADGRTFATRQVLDQQRQFVRKYNNSRIMQGAYAVQRARAQAGASIRGGASGQDSAMGRAAIPQRAVPISVPKR